MKKLSLFFRAAPLNRLHFYLDSSLHRISSLFSYCSWRIFCKKNLKIRFWNFKLIFVRMQFSLLQTFFFLDLVICLSWYLHLKLSRDLSTLVLFTIWRYKFTCGAIYLTLWKQNGLSKRLKDQSTWTGPKYKCKVSSYMDSTKCYYVVDLILDSISIILVFYCKFWAFRIILVYIPYIYFYLRMNIPNIHNNIKFPNWA